MEFGMKPSRESKSDKKPKTGRGAAVGWASFVLALYAAAAAYQAMEHSGIAVPIRRSLQALIMVLIVVPAVLSAYSRRKDEFPLRLRNGYWRREISAGLLAAGIAVALAGAAFGIAHGLGWIVVEEIRFTGTLLTAMAFNLCFALFYEALPEELVFRSLIPDALGRRMRAAAAFLLAPVLFVLAPIATRALQAATGLEAQAVTADYVVLLFFFAIALQAARFALGGLGGSIGFHLAYLMLARFVVLAEPGEGLVRYVEAEPETGRLFVLFLGVVVGGAAAFAVMAGLRRRRLAGGAKPGLPRARRLR
ncbi:CPBP family glutamic-type intramembrane protease [Saccharibacillus alkalitolerans]|uniref:CPBP family intramembrane metalloprotease n=1 Tax=Saccharibacillus alkalitolerans TaxID=2705290 RepID=A0ABX0F6J5_9BACL|nr:CPBP family glutamic-type intramembrane protease [Saccharibacillus alkalitolerans]NGZ76382.1 CPBP family intramembrane metalloprotease [Saccharibacillus alkalitolerans]